MIRHLAVAAASRSSLDSKGWALAGLPDTAHSLLVQVGSQCLAEAHSRGALALA